ncbi:MAG TPA: ABC transporter permease [Chlamydiales bacterium]|nr:ABC transporter permease [Chlamydiales bacterium]
MISIKANIKDSPYYAPIMIISIYLISLFLCAIFVPIFSPYSYSDIHLHLKNSPPSFAHIFGTDELGRDIFTRTMYGAKISLSVGIIAALLDILVGILWGSIAALAPKKVDETMMRICDIISSIPYLLIVILLIIVFGPGFLSIIIALSITGWMNMARIIRGEVLKIKEKEYIAAAKVLGCSKWRLLYSHFLPNMIGPIIVTLTFTIPHAIFTEAFLSFLGLGIQAPISSWGVMVNDSIGAMRYYPWRLFFPAFFMMSTLLSLNLLGDFLKELFDPRRGSND